MKLNGSIFEKENCIVVKMQNFCAIYYEKIYKNWFTIEIFFDILIHASNLFCLRQKCYGQFKWSWPYYPDIMQSIDFFCLTILNPSLFRSFPAFPILTQPQSKFWTTARRQPNSRDAKPRTNSSLTKRSPVASVPKLGWSHQRDSSR